VVPAGELTAKQQRRLREAVAQAEQSTGLRFSVYVGALAPDARKAAEGLHARLSAPAESILVAVDSDARAVEVVTGADAARRLDDRGCALAVGTMVSQFATGRLADGLVDGLAALTAHTRPG
jgi:uncharacterized membrane protein